MKTRNAMQLKALVNNYAVENRLIPQIVLQNYHLQRFVERLGILPTQIRLRRKHRIRRGRRRRSAVGRVDVFQRLRIIDLSVN